MALQVSFNEKKVPFTMLLSDGTPFLPDEMSLNIFGYLAASGELSVRRVDKASRRLFDAALKDLWNSMKEPTPEGQFNFPALQLNIEGTPVLPSVRVGQTIYADIRYLFLFKQLARVYAQERAMHLPQNFLPTTPAHFQAVDAHHLADCDATLVAIWPKIRDSFSPIATKYLMPNPLPQTPAEIRAWMRDPNSEDVLETALELNLSSMELNVLPEEVGLLKKLRQLDLSCNHLQTLPISMAMMTDLYTLRLSENPLFRLPDFLMRMKDVKVEFRIQDGGGISSDLYVDLLTKFSTTTKRRRINY